MLKLQAACDDDIADLRNCLLFQLGYESMLCCSEIGLFKFNDVKTLPNGNVSDSYEHQKPISLVRVS